MLLTTGMPTRGSAGEAALAAVTGPGRPIHDVVEVRDANGHERLLSYAGPRR